jgi:hypothetical protein
MLQSKPHSQTAGLPHLNPEDLFAVLVIPTGFLSFLAKASGTIVLPH